MKYGSFTEKCFYKQYPATNNVTAFVNVLAIFVQTQTRTKINKNQLSVGEAINSIIFTTMSARQKCIATA
jgi:hypothetical protein